MNNVARGSFRGSNELHLVLRKGPMPLFVRLTQFLLHDVMFCSVLTLPCTLHAPVLPLPPDFHLHLLHSASSRPVSSPGFKPYASSIFPPFPGSYMYTSGFSLPAVLHPAALGKGE